MMGELYFKMEEKTLSRRYEAYEYVIDFVTESLDYDCEENPEVKKYLEEILYKLMRDQERAEEQILLSSRGTMN